MKNFTQACVALAALAWAILPVSSTGAVVESDVCVYGGTSGGVIAAVQAARMGKSVVLVEPGRHIGGMTSGGLGLTDTGNSATLGGLAREFYRRVGQRYGATEAFTFEPHVAEQVFRDLLAEVEAPIYFEQRIVGVARTGLRITALTTERGDQFRAKMFLDTTYEGDLLAMAGVSFTFGRESTNAHGESLNGIRASTPSHQFVVAVDPYVVAGNPGSGLLPLVQPGDGGTPGDGDRSAQAYNFRVCLTQVATNRLPIAPPADYDPARYELPGRSVAAQAGGSAPTAFTSFTYAIGGGPWAVPGVNLSFPGDNGFHEWTADLSTVSALDNQRSVALTWTFRDLASNPSESFCVDNFQLTAEPMGD